MKKEETLFDTDFLRRFSNRKIFLLLSGVFVAGVFAGSMAASVLELFQGQTTLPLLFSGIPSRETGFISCCSTVLLNVLIGLIVLFLLGVTAFGAVGVPVFLFIKGAAVGIGTLSFFADGGWSGLGCCALCYTPPAAATALLLLLFATRALSFSNGLAKAGFSSQQESLDFQFYFKDFLSFLCFAVAVSVVGGLLSVLCGVMF